VAEVVLTSRPRNAEPWEPQRVSKLLRCGTSLAL